MPELTITGWQESKQKLRSPLYSLFKNQCYWFSNFIYEAAKVLDEKVSPRLDRLNDRHQPLPRGQMENLSSIETDEFFISTCLRLLAVGSVSKLVRLKR